ncbi:MAG: hypothetical protein WBL39_02310 [Terrimicrobiaceae bacterium]
MDLLDLRDVVSGMKRELRCLLRENIRLHVSDTSDTVGCVRAVRGDIEDLIRYLVLDARDAMPAGGGLCIFTGTVALDADYARTHPEVPPGDYARLTICDTGDGSNAEALKRWVTNPPSARVGASASPPAMASLTGSAGIFVSHASRMRQ